MQVSWYHFKQLAKQISFKDYVKDEELNRVSRYSRGLRDKTWLGVIPDMLTCYEYLSTSDGIELDFIGSFESLQEDFDKVCDKINKPRQRLPHINKSNHTHYSDYYDDETREIVAKRYAKDIEYFNYSFNER